MEGFLTPVLPGCRWLQEHHSAASRTKFELTVDWISHSMRTEFCNCSVLNIQLLYSTNRIYEMIFTELGVSTTCGAVSTRRITVFLPGLLEL